jgi:hypothetical protein
MEGEAGDPIGISNTNGAISAAERVVSSMFDLLAGQENECKVLP